MMGCWLNWIIPYIKQARAMIQPCIPLDLHPSCRHWEEPWRFTAPWKPQPTHYWRCQNQQDPMKIWTRSQPSQPQKPIHFLVSAVPPKQLSRTSMAHQPRQPRHLRACQPRHRGQWSPQPRRGRRRCDARRSPRPRPRPAKRARGAAVSKRARGAAGVGTGGAQRSGAEPSERSGAIRAIRVWRPWPKDWNFPNG